MTRGGAQKIAREIEAAWIDGDAEYSLVDAITTALLKAVEEEREACKRIAQEEADHFETDGRGVPFDQGALCAARNVVARIAARAPTS